MALPTKAAFSKLTATEYNAIVNEMAPVAWLTATIVNGSSGTVRYRRLLIPANTVQITGALSGGTRANGTTLFTLPVALRPVSNQDLMCSCDTLTTGGQNPHVSITTAGVVACWGVSSAGGISFNGNFPTD